MLQRLGHVKREVNGSGMDSDGGKAWKAVLVELRHGPAEGDWPPRPGLQKQASTPLLPLRPAFCHRGSGDGLSEGCAQNTVKPSGPPLGPPWADRPLPPWPSDTNSADHTSCSPELFPALALLGRHPGAPAQVSLLNSLTRLILQAPTSQSEEKVPSSAPASITHSHLAFSKNHPFTLRPCALRWCPFTLTSSQVIHPSKPSNWVKKSKWAQCGPMRVNPSLIKNGKRKSFFSPNMKTRKI